MSLRQQSASAAAFEIRFSTTDSELEIFEIQTDNNPHERNVPDPFKKRDKIPRSSGSMEQFIISNNNNNSSNSNNSNSNNSNNNITAAVRHSSLDSQTSPLMLKSRRHVNGDNLNSPSKKVMSTNSDQISSLKAKSSNAVGPEAINGIIKNSNVDVNASDDDSISRNAQYKKQRSLKIDEIASEKEGKVVSNHQITDLNGKTEPVVSNNKIIMPKNTLKNKKINMLTNNYNEDENKSLATPPATPPFTPHISSMTPLSESDIINLEEPQLVTPPSSSSARSSGESISRVTQQMPRSSKKRRGSQSSQLSIEFQPAAKLQAPRGRKLSSTERPITISEQSQTTQLPIKSKETQTSQQSQPIPIKSRIPRLSMSSRERPVIAKKESEGSLSLSSQDLNRYDDPNESLSSSYPVTSKSQPPRGLRSAISRPIINTSFMTDMEVESESPTSYSPSSYSSAGYSPTSYSPTTMSHSLPKRSQISHPPPPIRSSTSPPVYQKKLISHDDVIIPTIAKKLKMNGQLHFVNHDALLGYSEEPEDISPTSENGYMDITDQVVDLFDGSGSKSHKSQLPVHGSQRRIQQSVRKSSSTGHSRNSSKTHYIVPRKQNYKPPAEESSNPTNTQSSNRPMFVDDDFNKQRKSRREEYIMVIQDDDDDNNIESNDPHSSMPLDPSVPSIPSEPIIAPTEQVESNDQIYQEKIEEPVPVQKMSVMQETLNPTEVTTVPTVTSGKIKKGKKKQKKGSSEKHNKGNGEPDEENVRKSLCRCM